MKTASSKSWLFAVWLLFLIVRNTCDAFVGQQRRKLAFRHDHAGPNRFVQTQQGEQTAIRISRCSSSSSSLLLATTTTVINESTLWTIRAASALFSYLTFVGYYDRPRGELCVDNDKVEIRASTVPGAGLGLFARQNLSRGTILGTYPGVVIPLSQNLSKLQKYPECEAYIWRFSDNAFVIDPTNAEGKVDDVCWGGRDGLPGSQLLFRTILSSISVPTTLCRINEPPLGKDVNVVTDEDLSGRFVTFSLERNVEAGEEFFIDYGLSYDRSMYGDKPTSVETGTESDIADDAYRRYARHSDRFEWKEGGNRYTWSNDTCQIVGFRERDVK